MAKVKYLGPSGSINVEPGGVHLKDEVKEYPEDVAKELIKTSKKQTFEIMGIKPPSSLGPKTEGKTK